MVHQTPFTIHHCGTNSTIITYDYLHNDVYYHSPITYSAQRCVHGQIGGSNKAAFTVGT